MAALEVSMLRKAFWLCATTLAWHVGALDLPCPGATTIGDILDNVDLTGKVAIVTGGDSGLGFATSLELAKRGATVIIGNHNQKHGESAAMNITEQTGAKVIALRLNLGDFASVRAFKDSFLQQFEGPPQLHMLVNNAGIEHGSRETPDGFESVFEVDYLGPFLLTELLLPTLRETKSSRIVNTASIMSNVACFQAGFPADCLKDWTYFPPPVTTDENFTTYGIAKFAQIQQAAALAMREPGVEAFAVDPGLVTTPLTHAIEKRLIKYACPKQSHPGAGFPEQPCPFSPDEGAAVIGMCAAGIGKLVSGSYYDRIMSCTSVPIEMQGFTQGMILELYEKSLEWVGLPGKPLVVV